MMHLVLLLALVVVVLTVCFWVCAALAATAVVLFARSVLRRGMKRLRPQPIRVMRQRLSWSLDERMARRWAWQELHKIERAAGLPLTQVDR